MKKLLMIKLLVLLFSNISFGQSLNINWQACYGGSGSDDADDLLELNNGYFILGTADSDDGDISYNHGGDDVWLIKIDNIGNLVWEKTFGGSVGDGGHRIFNSTDNTYYLLAGAYSSDGDISNDPYPESTDYWIVKIDSSGNILWDRIIGGNILDQLWTGTLTDDGGVVALGWSGSEDGDVTEHFGAYDMWMVKLNSEGEKEWDFTIGTNDFDYGQAIIQTSDWGFLVGGASTIGEGGNLTCVPHSYKPEAILFKLDSLRNIEWQNCYGGSEDDGITGLLEIDDGYIFIGHTLSNDGDVSGHHGITGETGDIWVVKINFYGNIIWQKCLGGSRFEDGSKILRTEDSGFIIIGCTQSHDGDVIGNHTLSEYDHDIWVVKLSGEGDLLWQQCIGGIGNEIVDFGVIKKSDNNYVIAGQTDYGPSFDVECTPHAGNYPDFWVFEITDTSTNIINNTTNEKVIKVYPNPAKDYVVFEIPLTVISNSTVIPNTGAGTSAGVRKPLTITITNIFGQVVATLSIKNQKLKNQKLVWDTRNIKSGVYFYNLNLEGFSKIGKIVISK